LCVICEGTNASAGPARTIIGGPGANGLYTEANGSLTRWFWQKGGHNPFLAEAASFDLKIPEGPLETSVESVVFRFGTDFDRHAVAGIQDGSLATPEPPTGLLILGASGLLVWRLRSRAGKPAEAAQSASED
jgi:hypothetical protein